MKDKNLFALNGDRITDKKVIELLNLSLENKGSIKVNLEILEQARTSQLDKYPKDAEEINRMFDNAIYYMKVKLATRGMYHDEK